MCLDLCSDLYPFFHTYIEGLLLSNYWYWFSLVSQCTCLTAGLYGLLRPALSSHSFPHRNGQFNSAFWHLIITFYCKTTVTFFKPIVNFDGTADTEPTHEIENNKRTDWFQKGHLELQYSVLLFLFLNAKLASVWQSNAIIYPCRFQQWCDGQKHAF